MKKIALIGSTGSIGTQTLEIVRNHPEEYKVVALACGRNLELLEAEMREFHPSFVSWGMRKGPLPSGFHPGSRYPRGFWDVGTL